MRVLVYGINYTPELIGTGKYTGEMAEWLVGRGHDVRVVTGIPYYPDWRVHRGYCSWRYSRESIVGVDVWRCPLWVPGGPTGLRRVLHHCSFAASSFPVLLGHGLRWRPDVVLTVAPSLLSAPAGWMAARAGGGQAWLHVQDFEVEAAYGLGLLRSEWLGKLLAAAERWLFARFDRVSTISERMLDRLVEKGIPKDKCWLMPNWVDVEMIHPLTEPSQFRAELGIGANTIVALYSGNIGRKQGLEVIVEVARALEAEEEILFVLCGEGPAKHGLAKQAEGLQNVMFLPLQKPARLNDLLNMADIHLLPQRADVEDLVMPSKLGPMMASGRPVVATASEGTQLASVVTGCGVVVAPGDAVALERAIRRLASDREWRQRLGAKAREVAVQTWNASSILGEAFALSE